MKYFEDGIYYSPTPTYIFPFSNKSISKIIKKTLFYYLSSLVMKIKKDAQCNTNAHHKHRVFLIKLRLLLQNY